MVGTREALPMAVLLGGVVSGSGRRPWALVIDGVLILTACLLTVTLLLIVETPTWTTALVTVLVLGAAVAALAAQHTRTGQTPGHTWLGLRTVDRTTALPPRLRRWRSEEVFVADLRAGRDPLRLQPTSGTTTTGTAETGRWQDMGESRRHVARLTIDDGTTFMLTGPTVIGRDPVAPAGSSWEVQAVPDLTRTIAKNHALLEPDAEGVWVTDLGSATGTTVMSRDGRRERIARGARAQAPHGGRVAVGSRLALVASGTEGPR